MAPLPAECWLAMGAAFGAIFGSFLNVCIYRLPGDESIVRPRSRCPACKGMIAWYDNVPLLSWFALGGRCRRCRVPISSRYVIVEAITAGLLAANAGLFLPEDPGGFLLASVLGMDAIVIAYIDYDHRFILDELTIPLACVSPVASALAPSLQQPAGPFLADEYLGRFLPGQAPLQGLLSGLPSDASRAALLSLLGIAAGWGGLKGVALFGRLVFRKEAMGEGDVKWAAAIGGLLGPEGMFLTFAAACLAGSVIGGGQILFGRARQIVSRAAGPRIRLRGHQIPFGPFLSLGTLAVLYYRGALIHFCAYTFQDWILALRNRFL